MVGNLCVSYSLRHVHIPCPISLHSSEGSVSVDETESIHEVQKTIRPCFPKVKLLNRVIKNVTTSFLSFRKSSLRSSTWFETFMTTNSVYPSREDSEVCLHFPLLIYSFHTAISRRLYLDTQPPGSLPRVLLRSLRRYPFVTKESVLSMWITC